MKRLLAAVVFLMVVWATPVYAQEYHYFPKVLKQKMAIVQPNGTQQVASVIVRFIPKDQWVQTARLYWKRTDPWELRAFTIQKNYEAREYEIYVRLSAKGEASLESLGHEMAHVFEFDWHPQMLEEESPNQRSVK